MVLQGRSKEGQVRPGAPRSGAALLLSLTMKYKEDTNHTQLSCLKKPVSFQYNDVFTHPGFLVKPAMTHLENGCNCHCCKSRNPCLLTVKQNLPCFLKRIPFFPNLCYN
ncbi:hypothetical protein MBAV_000275 [Candidatus Magnetobacterium bavaricum]|uniref:Uncharacterized protein n=1 Tax=Candidatus Magnetobacterium bavaricum TaxID=29290 RepID=A0A0F3H3L0_9BACT|nr:hypothetical protein MBAV_000275 [Candidatus Magnetobacterium bavaricum]